MPPPLCHTKKEMADCGSQSDDEVPMLSLETLNILKGFAQEKGLTVSDESEDILKSIQSHFDVKDREECFDFTFSSEDRNIQFSVEGVKRELGNFILSFFVINGLVLGQTLSSTGLTIWRAAEQLCDFIFHNSFIFEGKTVCELGAGLGVVSILLSKMNCCEEIVATDGDHDTIDLLTKNCYRTNSSDIKVDYLYWGQHQQFILKYSSLNSSRSMAVVLYPFDVIIAADVIYEDDQVQPLLDTAYNLLRGKFLIMFHS